MDDFEVIRVSKVGNDILWGWMRADERPYGNPMLTFGATSLASSIPPDVEILTLATVLGW